MKVATAFYDKNNLLVMPKKLWTGRHATENKLTLEGGYWHICTKYFDTPAIRDAIAAEALAAIERNNGTVIYDQIDEAPVYDPQTGERLGWRWYVQYIIEEPTHRPFPLYAATADMLGVDPEFVQPYDGVAEEGPDYRTPVAEQMWYQSALRDAVPAPATAPATADQGYYQYG